MSLIPLVQNQNFSKNVHSQILLGSCTCTLSSIEACVCKLTADILSHDGHDFGITLRRNRHPLGLTGIFMRYWMQCHLSSFLFIIFIDFYTPTKITKFQSSHLVCDTVISNQNQPIIWPINDQFDQQLTISGKMIIHPFKIAIISFMIRLMVTIGYF